MKRYFSITILYAFIVIFLIRCVDNTENNFVGQWIQIATVGGRDIKADEAPIKLKISKKGIFYIVEKINKKGLYESYPTQSGKYESTDNINLLQCVGRNQEWTIEYRDQDDILYESGWFGYFRKIK